MQTIFERTVNRIQKLQRFEQHWSAINLDIADGYELNISNGALMNKGILLHRFSGQELQLLNVEIKACKDKIKQQLIDNI